MAQDVFEIVGTVVGGAFTVEAVVGEGGFAVVYRAYHGAFRAPVALKCLKVPAVGRSEQARFLESFREESEVLFRLSQSIPSVVRPLHVDAFETSKGVFVPYMALEWLDGETLDVIIARRTLDGQPPLTLRQIVPLLTPVAHALARAHHFPGKDGPISIVHRDLKPDNIIIANLNGETMAKILDFGIAKVKSEASQVAGRLSQEGGKMAVPFTPGYAAPEQWLPKRYGQTGPWTDVWGLALTLVEALAGRAVIDGDQAAMMGTAIDPQRRPTPRNEGVDVPDAIESIFLKALAIDPRERYADAGTFWHDLEQVVLTNSERPSSRAAPRSDLGSHVSAPGVRAAQGGFAGELDIGVNHQHGSGAAHGGGPMPELPDLEIALPVSRPAAQAPARSAPVRIELADDAPSVRKSAAPRVNASGTSSGALALDLPSELRGGSSPGSGRANVAAERVPPASGPSAAPGSMRESRAARGSGIDLAVSAEQMRRPSSGTISAVRLTMPSSQEAPRVSQVQPAAPPAAHPHGSSQTAQHAPAKSTTPPSQLHAIPAFIASRKLALPIALTTMGLVLSLAYYIAASVGSRWMFGPIPINWIAALLSISGLGLVAFRLFWRVEE